MDPLLFGLTFLVVGVALGGVAVWLVIHERLKTAEDRGRGDMSIELAALRERAGRMPDLEAEAKSLRDVRQALEVKVAELSATLGAQKEKLAFLTEAKEELGNRFKNLANEILEEKSKRFAETNRQGLETLLAPLKEKIGEFQVKVEQTYDKESRERLTLQGEIKKLAELNEQISEDA